MTALAAWLATKTWAAMLWVMRRRTTKWLQRASLMLVPQRWREAVYRNHVRQNRFARRIGRPLLTFAFTIMLGSFLIAGMYVTVTAMYVSGAFTPPAP